MPLFQTSVLKTYLAQQEQNAIEKAYKKYIKYFHNITIQENIKNSKEEQFQATFLIELFVNVFNYTINPNPNFDLTTEFKNQSGAGKADGAILKGKTAIGVIELKGTNTKDLESIRKQAFDYKANQKGCVYVITSNFEKLRFYINDATEFLEFNLFQLAPEEFALLHLCLHKDNILNNLPLTIKEASLVEEEKITKQFYNDYSIFKRELFRDLVKRNAKRIKQNAVTSSDSQSESYREANDQKALEKNVKLSLFKKSQKLIDRFLFIFFAEDRDLLPPNSTIQILDKWKADVDFGDDRPLYTLFKQYFHFLDEGRKGTTSRAEIYAYNGGLFKPDGILDNLEIDDQLLYKHAYKLAKYDFSSQVDVNILGHIFENSLNEIESVNAEIEGGEFDKQKSKRKKDGVFYTPKYITKYIVENTVGKLCQEKKEALGFKEEAYFEVKRGTHQNTKKQLLEVLETYREWLLQITICDPACGSGAFLNQALDFLIKEHRYIDELKSKVLGGGLILSDIENTILENNIYGVDLNEESVEIAKLSLWLRTAQPRRKLNDLSNNIKCGNSLIDSKAVAGDKAFNWHNEFPQIFNPSLREGTTKQSHETKQGFDVVIGNPPYVRVQNLDSKSVDYYFEKYKSPKGKLDLSILFFEKIQTLLNNNGRGSFISSSQWMQTEYGQNLREILSTTKKISEIVDFGSLPVFDGVSTYPAIFVFNEKYADVLEYKLVTNKNQLNLYSIQSLKSKKINYKTLGAKPWSFSNLNLIEYLTSKNKDFHLLNDIGKAYYGIVTGMDKAFILNDETIKKFNLETNIIYPFAYKGEEVDRYIHTRPESKVIYPYLLNDRGEQILLKPQELQTDYPNIYRYLLQFKTDLEKRMDSRKLYATGDNWFSHVRQGNMGLIESKKLQIRGISHNIKCGLLDSGNAFSGANCPAIILDVAISYSTIMGIINSSLIDYYLKQVCPKKLGGYIRYNTKSISAIPIVYPQDENSFEIIVNQISQFHELRNNTLNKFIQFYRNTLELKSISRKLENWHELDFAEFIKELNKAIKKAGGTPLTKKDEFDWLELFEENKKKAQDLQSQITQTEKTIDTMVYDLYGLTQEERDIVEIS